MNDVNLLQMLNAREMRAATQQRLIGLYQKPLICLTLNIPGPVKVLPGIPQAFDIGCKRIQTQLQENNIPVIAESTVKENTGYEAFYCVDSDGPRIKQLMIQLEDQDAVGRLFDIDVIETDGTKISRTDMGIPARRCLLCEEPAHNCSRSRKHTVKELLDHIERILADCPLHNQADSKLIASFKKGML